MEATASLKTTRIKKIVSATFSLIITERNRVRDLLTVEGSAFAAKSKVSRIRCSIRDLYIYRTRSPLCETSTSQLSRTYVGNYVAAIPSKSQIESSSYVSVASANNDTRRGGDSLWRTKMKKERSRDERPSILDWSRLRIRRVGQGSILVDRPVG